MKDLGLRVISGIIGLAILIGIVNLGGNILNIAVLIISLIGLREFFLALRNKNFKPLTKIAYLAVVLLFFINDNGNEYLGLIISGLVMILMINILFDKVSLMDLGVTLLSIFYIPFLLNHIVYLDGSKYIWLVFIIAFGTDTFAYFVGNLFGKNKLCPDISPNKTVEGAIGGVVGSLLLTIVFSIVFKTGNMIKLIPLAIMTSVISQLGDLVASRIKRYVGIKDYGFLIPGHGGILDRFDSIIFTAPVVYYYCHLFIR